MKPKEGSAAKKSAADPSLLGSREDGESGGKVAKIPFDFFGENPLLFRRLCDNIATLSKDSTLI